MERVYHPALRPEMAIRPGSVPTDGQSHLNKQFKTSNSQEIGQRSKRRQQPGGRRAARAEWEDAGSAESEAAPAAGSSRAPQRRARRSASQMPSAPSKKDQHLGASSAANQQRSRSRSANRSSWPPTGWPGITPRVVNKSFSRRRPGRPAPCPSARCFGVQDRYRRACERGRLRSSYDGTHEDRRRLGPAVAASGIGIVGKSKAAASADQ